MKIAFNSSLCIQCHACESACKNWRHTESGISWRRVVMREEGQFPFTRASYHSMACLHCAKPACRDVCPSGAITREASGAVVVDSSKCTGCRKCCGACPIHIPQFGADGTMQKCDLCCDVTPDALRCPCARMCPTGALFITK